LHSSDKAHIFATAMRQKATASVDAEILFRKKQSWFNNSLKNSEINYLIRNIPQ